MPYEETDLRRFVRDLGADHLVIDDLQVDDLEGLGWSGSPVHLEHVANDLQHVEGGGIDYLAARLPDGTPVAKGGVDYVYEPGQGSIYQLVTRAELRGLGIGTRLIREAEERIRDGRSPSPASASRSTTHVRASLRTARVRGDRRASRRGEDMRPDGSVFTYETVLTEMKKRLGPS